MREGINGHDGKVERNGCQLVVAVGALIGLVASPAFAEEDEAGTELLVAPLVVTASPLASPLDDLAAPVTVLTREDILTSSATSLGALLKDEPGISQSAFASGASRPIIRGLDNNRVRVQENGIGVGDVSAVSEDHGVPIAPYAADRVEVIRGPATLRYGSEAIGGVINVINERIPRAVPKGGFEAEASASYDSVSTGRQI